MCEHTNQDMTLARKTARLGMLIHRYYQESAQGHGASSPLRGQGRILALLANKPKTTQRELSFLLDMRQQSLSELLGKLEEKGYITRSRSEDDARVTVVELTEEGKAALPSLDTFTEMPDAFDVLNDEEKLIFEQHVDTLSNALKEKLANMGIDADASRPHAHRHRKQCQRGDGDNCRRGPHKGPHPLEDENFTPDAYGPHGLRKA